MRRVSVALSFIFILTLLFVAACGSSNRERGIYAKYQELLEKASSEAEQQCPTRPDYALKVGDEYVFSKKGIVLMTAPPDASAEELLKAAAHPIRLPKGTRIKVLETKDSDGARYYKIRAISPSGRKYVGWMKGSMLIGEIDVKKLMERNKLCFEKIWAGYKKQILNEYSISEEELEKIISKGIKEGW